MPKFIVEVPHSGDQLACARLVQMFLQTGSHFLMNADWGCVDGIHKAWILLEADNREEARSVLPPAIRSEAAVIQLNKFSMEQVEGILGQSRC